jgi:hypothetical protein
MSLGGRAWGDADCLKHSLQVPRALHRVPRFAAMFASLQALPAASLKSWVPPNPADPADPGQLRR